MAQRFTPVTPEALRPLSDGELIRLRRSFAQGWEMADGRELPEGLNREEFLNRFAFVVAEIRRRGLKVDLSDAIGQAAVKELGLSESNALPHPLDRTACEKLLAGLPDELVVCEDFVRFGGPFLTEENGDRTVKVYLHDCFKDSSRDLKLYRMVRAAANCESEFVLCPEGYPEDVDLVEGYDLILRKCRGMDLNVVDEPEYQARVYGGEEPDAEQRIPLKERRQALADGLVDFVTIPAFVCVTGSYIYHQPERKPNDIDIVVKSFDARDDIRKLLEGPIREITGIEPQLVWEPRGPNWSFAGIFDLVCRVRRPQRAAEQELPRALKVPDPKFIIDRLSKNQDAILLSAQDRSGLEDNEWILVNERIKPDEPILAWARVRFKQLAQTIKNVGELGNRTFGLDRISLREFSAREGPFYVLVLEPEDIFRNPVPLKEPPPGRRFGGPLNVEKARLQESVFTVNRDGDLYYCQCPKCGKIDELTPAGEMVIPKGTEFKDGRVKADYIRTALECEACGEKFAVYTEDGLKQIEYRDLSKDGKDGHGHAPYAITDKDEVVPNREFVLRRLKSVGLKIGDEVIFEKYKRIGRGKIVGVKKSGRIHVREPGEAFDRTIDFWDINMLIDDPSAEGMKKFKPEDLEKARVREQVDLTGAHPHPHTLGGGKHDHPDLPLDTGDHDHAEVGSFNGEHRHRPDDPVEGPHQNSEGDTGPHAHPKALARAQEAELQEAVKPGRFFLPQKPAFGFREPDGRDEAWKEFVEPALKAGHRVAADIKKDGIRLTHHRLGGKGSEVRIFTEKKGLERSKFLPALTEVLKDLPGGSFILDSETIMLVDGKPGIRREFAPKLAVQTKEPVTDELESSVFDIVESEGKDLTDLDYAVRLEILKKRLPRRVGPLSPLPRIEVKTRAQYDEAVDQVEGEAGSEGAMLKILTGPDSKYAIETARSTGMAKLKIVSSVSGLVIGRRKQPASFKEEGLKEPEQPVSGRGALGLFRRLAKPEKTFIYRVAIINDENALQEINSRQKYTPDDLSLRWVPAGAIDPLTKQKNTGERGEWRGTDDPAVWEMGKGWPQAKKGEWQYGKSFAVKLDNVIPGKDLAEFSVGEIQEWKDDEGRVRYSWTFPAPVEKILEPRKPDAVSALRKTARFISEIEEAAQDVGLHEAKKLGAFLRAQREKKGWTIADMARKFKMAASTVSSVELGKTIRPPDDCLKMFADALGLSHDRLIRMRDEEVPK